MKIVRHDNCRANCGAFHTNDGDHVVGAYLGYVNGEGTVKVDDLAVACVRCGGETIHIGGMEPFHKHVGDHERCDMLHVME